MAVKGKAVVLGGYGLIGAACCRALRAAGFAVTGVGRSVGTGRRVVPGIDWQACDLARETDWGRVLAGADVVVNASGALQDGLRDDLEAIHVTAVRSICAALEGTGARLIQISAAGVNEDAATAFFRSKARGDAAIAASGVDHVILRPVLVIGAQAYGGTALLRAVAAFPGAEPRVMGATPVSCVALEDVASAVVLAAEGRIPGGTVADLTEAERRSFAETVRQMRRWMGFADWRRGFSVPRGLLNLTGRAADALGWLGWRAPLRSTALRQLQAGITGDPAPWIAAGGAPMRGLPQILEDLPATVQERLYARSWPLLPLGLGVLSLFWLLSGLIGALRFDAAVAVLSARGMGQGLAEAAVQAGTLADIALGGAVLLRRTARMACLGMIAVSAGYLLMGSLLTPDLWADPLGPFVKVLPGMVLALAVHVWLEER